MAERFQVRDATGPGWEWLGGWCVIDTAKQVRVALYPQEREARNDCAARNAAAMKGDTDA